MVFGFPLQAGGVGLTVSYVVHVLFGALMAGAVLFFTYGVNPVAHAGDMGPETLSAATGKLTMVTRVSSVFVLLTGGHQAAALFDSFAALTGTGRGQLVLGMLVLWLAMVAFVEMGASKLREGTDRDKVRTPAREARPFLRAASVMALLVLVDAGLLAAGATL